MNAEEQGLYRNLCDEVWVRDGKPIPGAALARASGDPVAWARCSERVLCHMRKVDGGWTNDKALEVMTEAERRAEKQRNYRARRRSNVAGNGDGNAGGNGNGNKPGSPSPSMSPSITDITEKEKGVLELLRCPRCAAVDSLLRERHAVKEPGWWCVPKRGGCGANFPLNEPRVYGALPDNVKRSIDSELAERGAVAAVRSPKDVAATAETVEYYEKHGPPQALAKECAAHVRAQEQLGVLTHREAIDAWLEARAAPQHVRIEVLRRTLTEVERAQ